MCLYFRLVFLLGMVSDVGLQKPLLDEAMKYNDIVQGRFKSIYMCVSFSIHMPSPHWLDFSLFNLSSAEMHPMRWEHCFIFICTYIVL